MAHEYTEYHLLMYCSIRERGELSVLAAGDTSL